MEIRPLADRVVIKKLEAEEKTKGGIILTGSAKEQPQEAEVVEVGPGGVVDGKEVKMEVKKGDKVLFSKFSIKLNIFFTLKSERGFSIRIACFA